MLIPHLEPFRRPAKATHLLVETDHFGDFWRIIGRSPRKEGVHEHGTVTCPGGDIRSPFVILIETFGR
jgi:hypothetical protein